MSVCNPKTKGWKRASNYLSSNLKPGDRVVLCCVVASKEQKRRGTLKRQVKGMREELLKLQVKIVKVICRVVSTKDPSWVSEAVIVAKQFNAKLVAQCTFRFIRHPEHDAKKRPGLQAEDIHFDKLMKHLDDVDAISFLHPDLSPHEVHSYQTKKGQILSGNKGGRPVKKEPGYKKNRKLAKRPIARKMRRGNWSLGGISKILKVSRSTIQAWVA